MSTRIAILALILLLSIANCALALSDADLCNATVRISNPNDNSIGSGFVVSINSKDVFVVTACHVISGDKMQSVEFDCGISAVPVDRKRTCDDFGTAHDYSGIGLLIVERTAEIDNAISSNSIEVLRAASPRAVFDSTSTFRAVGQPSEKSWSVVPTTIANGGQIGDTLYLSRSTGIGAGFSGGPIILSDSVVGMVQNDGTDPDRNSPVAASLAADIVTCLVGWGVLWNQDNNPAPVGSNIPSDLTSTLTTVINGIGNGFADIRGDIIVSALSVPVHRSKVSADIFQSWNTSIIVDRDTTTWSADSPQNEDIRTAKSQYNYIHTALEAVVPAEWYEEHNDGSEYTVDELATGASIDLYTSGSFTYLTAYARQWPSPNDKVYRDYLKKIEVESHNQFADISQSDLDDKASEWEPPDVVLLIGCSLLRDDGTIFSWQSAQEKKALAQGRLRLVSQAIQETFPTWSVQKDWLSPGKTMFQEPHNGSRFVTRLDGADGEWWVVTQVWAPSR